MTKLLLFLLFSFAASLSSFAQIKFNGNVTKVIDGSSFVVKTTAAEFNVRLQFIDPPEDGQALHSIVKSHLEKHALNKQAFVFVRHMNDGMHVSRVIVDGRDLSLQMLRDGAAWYSHPEAKNHEADERSQYLEAERMAQLEKRGVWGIADLTPAWQLREAREKERAERLQRERDEALQLALRGAMPRTPAIGMSEGMFLHLCGSEKGDTTNVTVTRSGITVRYRLVSTPKRAGNACVGYFSFDEGRLTYISVDFETE